MSDLEKHAELCEKISNIVEGSTFQEGLKASFGFFISLLDVTDEDKALQKDMLVLALTCLTRRIEDYKLNKADILKEVSNMLFKANNKPPNYVVEA